MHYYDDPGAVIDSTLSHLSATKSEVEAIRCDIVEAFNSNALPEGQLQYMKERVEKFLNQIDVYESIFAYIRDVYDTVK